MAPPRPKRCQDTIKDKAKARLLVRHEGPHQVGKPTLAFVLFVAWEGAFSEPRLGPVRVPANQIACCNFTGILFEVPGSNCFRAYPQISDKILAKWYSEQSLEL